tara:strand:+ start:235 stop:492 length:258 start_codon:yes stop_codon:yes gene_type:complete
MVISHLQYETELETILVAIDADTKLLPKKMRKTYLVTSTNENSPTIRLKGIEAVASLIQCIKSMVSKMLKNKTEYKGYKVKSEPD